MTEDENKESKNSFRIKFKLFFKRVGNELDANARRLIRSPTTIFFTILYPVIFLLLLGSLFSGIEDPYSFDLYVQNHDSGVDVGPTTLYFWDDVILPIFENITNSNNESLLNVIDIPLIDNEGQNISAGQYLEEQEGVICLVIPEHFSTSINNTTPFNITMILVEDSQSAQIVSQIVESILTDLFSGGLTQVGVEGINILVGEEISYVEFLIPGLIALTFMSNSLMNTITRFNYNRISGFFKKLSSSPMRRIDFVFSEMTWQYIIALFALFIAVLTGWIAFGVPWSVINWMIFPIMLIGVMIFTGLGMIGSRITKTPSAASAVGNLLMYPMMFLSGAMFEVSHIPALNVISKILPVTYIVDALRAAMITNNMASAWINTGISFGIAVVFMTIGILVTKWTDD